MPRNTSWSAFEDLLAGLEGGKRVGRAVYLHRSAIPDRIQPLVERAASIAEGPEDWNVVKLHGDEPKLSLLHYLGFMDEGFPRLGASWTVNLEAATCTERRYSEDANRPVLHRKELLLADDHPRRPEFVALTRRAEQAGLFSDRSIIGHEVQWEEELRARGVAVRGNELVARDATDDEAIEVQRHRTALSRSRLSTPMQALWRHGFLDGRHDVFDYGCGRGDDLSALGARGLRAAGWDPHYRPEGDKREADVVNLGFVLNVIEDTKERREALQGAWKLTRHVLAVAALIGGRTAYEKHRLFRDGVLTSRGTFQKYFTQAELGEYIEGIVGREPIPVAPGVYFVFRTDEGEQAFLERKQWSRGRTVARTRLPSVPRRPRRKAPKRPNRWQKHAELVDRFWERALELGRAPSDFEFEDEQVLRDKLGTPKRVMQHCLERFGDEDLDEARDRRMADVGVYLALNLFEKRRSFGALSPRLRADIKAFWGSYKTAVADATQLLFSIGDPANIEQAAASAGFGHYEPDHALTTESQLVNELPPILRVYVGCAAKLYGDVQDADLLKIHTTSGKLTLLTYDDLYGKLLPELIERVKIDLRRQSIRFFEYGTADYPAQLLYLKSRYLTDSADGYEEQLAFDEALEAGAPFDLSGFGPDRDEFMTWFKEATPPHSGGRRPS